MLRVVPITTLESLLELKLYWNSLLEKSGTNYIFLTFEWILCWWQHFGKRRELHVLTVWDDETLIGIAPFMIRSNKLLKYVEFIGRGTADYHDFILVKDRTKCMDIIFSYFMQNGNIWDIIDIMLIRDDSPNLVPLYEVLQKYSIRFISNNCYQCPCIYLPQSWDLYEKTLSKNLVNDTRRCLRRLKDLGPYEIIHSGTNDVLDSFFDQHINRWKALGISSKFSNKVYRKFYSNLATIGKERGWFSLSCLVSNGRPISFIYGFIYSGIYSYLFSSYDLSYKYVSPGKILLQDLLLNCIKNRVYIFDFGGGTESYKFQYSNFNRETRDVMVFRDRFSDIIHYTFSSIEKTYLLRSLRKVYKVLKWFFGDKYEKFIIKGNKNADLAF